MLFCFVFVLALFLCFVPSFFLYLFMSFLMFYVLLFTFYLALFVSLSLSLSLCIFLLIDLSLVLSLFFYNYCFFVLFLLFPPLPPSLSLCIFLCYLCVFSISLFHFLFLCPFLSCWYAPRLSMVCSRQLLPLLQVLPHQPACRHVSCQDEALRHTIHPFQQLALDLFCMGCDRDNPLLTPRVAGPSSLFGLDQFSGHLATGHLANQEAAFPLVALSPCGFDQKQSASKRVSDDLSNCLQVGQSVARKMSWSS